MTMLVDVLMSDTELVRMEAKAKGSRSRDGLVPLLAARANTTGIKKAVAAVLLMNADSTDADTMMTASRTARRLPTCSRPAG